MRVVAVPVKSPRASKTRLSPLLGPDERAALTVAMFEDVLDACLGQGEWDVWVISADPTVAEIAAARGARPIPERGRGLRRAVRQVEADLTAGDDELAVVLGD